MKAQLEVEYADGKKETFVTDQSWKASQGALLESDLLNGETYDARLEQKGWDGPGFNDGKWQSAQVFQDKAERKIQVYPGPPVKITQTLQVADFKSRGEHTYIFNMGQNFAGIVRLHVKGQAGDTIRLRFGEKLHPDGRLMTENLRMARASDTYILKGEPAGDLGTQVYISWISICRSNRSEKRSHARDPDRRGYRIGHAQSGQL
nr:family 78 glycoside hydrolase catalytic domain [Dyadobacter sp. CY261]